MYVWKAFLLPFSSCLADFYSNASPLTFSPSRPASLSPSCYRQFGWAVLFNLDGPMFQDALHPPASCHRHLPTIRPIPAAHPYRPVQVESYYVSDEGRPYYHEIYYAAFFLADMAWPAGSDTRVEAAFGMPHDKSYCCGPASRWWRLQRQGFSPLSIALTEDPIALTVYVADVWSNAPTPAGWHTGVARTEEQLQQELAQLPHPLVPTYLKAYTVGLKRNTLFLPLHLFSLPPLSSSSPYQAGLLCVFYAYVARPPTSPTAPHRILTPDISRSGFELLALSLKHPPLLVASFLPPKFEGHGKSARERYTVLWQTDDYFERSYPGGWFTYGAILDSRVEASDLPALISSRERNHMPAFITAYAVASPRPLVYFSILWQPNSKSVGWVVVFNLDGQMFQDSLHRRIASGFKPAQVESYYVSDDVRPYYHEIYYSAIFLADVAWPAGSSMWVEAAFGMPHDASYCCGPTSRWWRLQRQGFSPLSVSLTEDPAALTVYVADVWSSPPSSGGWLGGVAMTEAELQQALAQLPPPLVPTFLKAYTVGMQVGMRGLKLQERMGVTELAGEKFVPPKCGEQGKSATDDVGVVGERGSWERYTVLWQTDGVGGRLEGRGAWEVSSLFPSRSVSRAPVSMDSRAANILAALFSLTLLAAVLPWQVSSSLAFRGGFGADFHLGGPVAAADGAFPGVGNGVQPLNGQQYQDALHWGGRWCPTPQRPAVPGRSALGWVMVFNLNGQQYQDALRHYISSGYKPSQVCPGVLISSAHACVTLEVESYYVADHHGLYYASIFLADVAWPAGSSTRVEAVFGVPHDSSYCCGPSSRWLQLQRQVSGDGEGEWGGWERWEFTGWKRCSASLMTPPTAAGPPPGGRKLHPVECVSLTEDPSSLLVFVADVWNDSPGYTPLSVSFTEDPSSQRVYVADVWNDAPSRGGWQGGVAKTQAQLQQALTQLLPPLVPTFLKAYTVGYQVFYAYIARAASSSPPRSTLTTDVSRGAIDLLSRSLKHPPLLLSPPALIVPFFFTGLLCIHCSGQPINTSPLHPHNGRQPQCF
ncbi:unnamed protein product [Closterium sp. NIES-65]|nr:unnamed protein product [Closterium sp. NIES-65]